VERHPADLATRLDAAARDVAAVIEAIELADWDRVPGQGVWSVGKDAEHLTEAVVYHLWIVRKTVGLPVSAGRPAIERSRLTTDLSPAAAADLLRRRTDEGVQLIGDLSEEQLALPTRPPRAGKPPLAVTIERVLIGHYRVHRDAIESKLRRR
jgi:DinB family protein